MQFIIPNQITQEDRKLLSIYLSDDQNIKRAEWARIFKAIDHLGRAKLVTPAQVSTFRQLYREYIDYSFADPYIVQLLALSDVQSQSPPLIAAFARQIGQHLQHVGLLDQYLTDSWLLLAYCLYWWQSFARGYAFEVQIIRDLQNSGIIFQTHDLRLRSERYSRADLKVLGLKGDIKTSTYFLKLKPTSSLHNDFYITRLYEKGRQRTFVVFQKPFAWRKINGESLRDAKLEELLRFLPQPVRVIQNNTELIVVEYSFWKDKILKKQQQEGDSNV